jgi:aflatoxin B1 aldehyde reductase
MATNGVKIVFGGAVFMARSVDEVTEWLKTLDELDIRVIDTAQLYGPSEEVIGKAGAASRFTIDTKTPGAWGPVSTKDVIIELGQGSLRKLKADAVGSNTTSHRCACLTVPMQLDVYYIHAPDRRVPWKETLSGLNELHKQGAFKRLGLSNFLGHEVDEIVQAAKDNNFVVPSVYQGNYSAVARRTEDEIFPTLRKHNMAFYAYSPIAGGFLAKSKAALTAAEGRFGGKNPLAQVYNGMYNRPSFVAALDVWEQIAKDEGATRAELAYRWVVYHSKLQGNLGDAVIVGARKQEQLRETVEAIKKGPLSDGAVKRISDIWESVKADASLDNFEMQNGK